MTEDSGQKAEGRYRKSDIRKFLASAFCLLTIFLLCAAQASAQFHGGPQVGEKAPKFSLKDLKGREVRLKDFRKKKPVVLVTGSYSCPVYRNNLSELKRLYKRYGKRAAFFVLYTVEAHPKGSHSPYTNREWVTEGNYREGILVQQPTTYEERVKLAARSQRALRSVIPVLVDEMDNATWIQYGQAPNTAYLIDSRGTVQIQQEWFDPLEFETELLKALLEEPSRL